ncbi:hypothetical protein [Labilibacter marinus]|uniref:hypothetical protein n=1 Tax=Labilibacter marinus TaxID=1477105 RepID=UPI00082F9A98|nr:hypothetical protein [Labilibacter marinus]
MSFGGSVAAMISSMKNNRKLLSQRKTFKDQKKDSRFRIGKALKFKEPSNADLLKIKERIRAKAIRQRRINTVIILVVVLVVSYLGVSFLGKVDDKYREIHTRELEEKEAMLLKIKEENEEEREELIVYFLNHGYECLSQEKYYYAKYYFKQIYDSEKDDYRVALAYTRSYVYDCINNKRECENTKLLIDRLKTKFGDKLEVAELNLLYTEHKY